MKRAANVDVAMSLILVGVASICAAHHPTSFIAADRGAQDGKPKSLVAVGDPAVEILKTAQAESIDLIVLAARGSGSDVQTGSVVEKVVRESSTPVVIVPSSGASQWRIRSSPDFGAKPERSRSEAGIGREHSATIHSGNAINQRASERQRDQDGVRRPWRGTDRNQTHG
jgi:hypothetical protein